MSCLLFLFINASAQAQNKVDFTADQWSGCGAIYVQFINQSAPAGGTASWDFGDGGAKSSLWNPARSFSRTGKYTVTLTVTFPDGSTGTASHDVNVYKKPEVKFATSPLEGCTPLNVSFTDQSSAGDGTISSISWDFGEGTGSTGPTASHTYEQGNNIKATSIVTNSFGCTNSAEQLIKVKATPKVDFTSDNKGGCKAPVTVNFVNNTTLNTALSVPVTYAWNFGDGGTSADMNPSHEYTKAGSYTVTLTATTSEGCTQTITKANYVVIATPKADFTIQEKPCRDAPLNFINTSQPIPQTATWTFSDGTVIQGVNAVKQFSAAGDYDVTMTGNTQDGCLSTITKKIHVAEPPKADFTMTPATGCSVPLDVQFTAPTPGVTNWKWNFADGGTSTIQNPKHTFTSETSYNVKLVVANADGCSDSLSKPINIKKPQLSITGPNSGCIPLDATFTPVITSADPVVSYNWNFGDGGTSTDKLPKHTFTKQGNFVVTLEITTQGGCTQKASLTTRVGEKVNVDFGVNKTVGCQSEPYTFTNKSIPPGTEWLWVFEDSNNPANTSTQQNPQFVFSNPGKHDVTLTVSNNGCTQTLTKPDFVEILPPASKFSIAKPNCANVYERKFTDQSEFGASATKKWSWDFGDGSPIVTTQSPTHEFPRTGSGSYIVTLIVDNGNCTSTSSQQVNIANDKPVIHASTNAICRSGTVNFSMDPVNQRYYSAYTWVWGDGTSLNVSSPDAKPDKKYNAPGVYKAKMVLTDIHGCEHPSDEITITVNGSTAKYSIDPRQCKGEPVSLTDNSTTRAGNSIVSWTWDFGDGSSPVTVTTKPVNYTHTYSVINKYPVKLTVKDNTGCEDTFVDTVRIANVVARFGANSTIACLNKDFTFSNFSGQEPLTYAWTFGDGGTSTDKEPKHVYTAPGSYTVKLDITSSTGCKDHSEIIDFIKVPNPIASFDFPQVSADVCPPVKVQFTNNSTGYIRSAWNFGDGSTSTEQTPLHNYIRPGTFPVTLTVFSEGNCASAPAGPKNVEVAGPDGTFSVSPEGGCFPLTTTMTAQSADAKKFIWDFGDGYSVTTTTPTSPAYTYKQEGVYFPVVLLEDERGCKVPARGNPKVVADKIMADFSADVTQACDGGTVYFKDKTQGISAEMGLPMTYSWDFGIPGRTDDVGTGAEPSFVYDQTGTYQVRLTTTSYYGCVDDTVISITIEPKPAAEILPITPICVGQSVLLQGRDNKNLPGTKWSWKVAPDKQYDVMSPPRITFNEAGNYAVALTVTTASGVCSSTDNKFVEVSALPALNPVPASGTICRGEDLQLQANTAAGVTVTWTDYKISDIHSASPVVSPEIDTVYHVVAENNIGCISESDVRIQVSQPFKVTVNDAEICVGKQVQLHASGAVSYKWTPAAGLSSDAVADPMASPDVSTTYQVTGYGNDDCFTDVAEATVTVNPSPTVDAGPDIELPSGSSIQLKGTGSPDITRVEWWPPNWLNCISCLTPVATPKQTTTYQVTVTNQFGCTSTDEMNIKMVCSSGVTFLPNTFSPNGDGQNDIFFIRGKGIKTVKSFRIYNRWGQLVFERANFNIEDASYGWDGRYKGTALNPDVYIYAAEMVCDSDETFTLKGDVMLLR